MQRVCDTSTSYAEDRVTRYVLKKAFYCCQWRASKNDAIHMHIEHTECTSWNTHMYFIWRSFPCWSRPGCLEPQLCSMLLLPALAWPSLWLQSKVISKSFHQTPRQGSEYRGGIRQEKGSVLPCTFHVYFTHFPIFPLLSTSTRQMMGNCKWTDSSWAQRGVK